MKILFFIMLVMFVSCSNNTDKKAQRGQTQINLQEAILSSNQKNIEYYCDSAFYVKLETKDTVLLKSPFYTFTPNAIIAYEGASLYRFSYTGEFLNSYIHKGQGPQDLLSINGVLWNKESRKLYVIDGAQGKLLIFDENLNYISHQSFRIPEYRLITKGDYIYIGLQRNDFNNSKFDLSVVRYDIRDAQYDVLCKSDIPLYNAKTYPMYTFGTYMSFEDSVFYMRENRSDTIFAFTAENTEKKYAYNLNVGEIYPAELDYDNNRWKERFDYIIASDCIFIDDYIFIYYTYKEMQPSLAVFHKDSGKVYCIKKSQQNLIDGGLPINLIKQVYGKRYYAGQIFPSIHMTDDFISRVSTFKGKNNSLRDILSKTTVDDNPILMFVDLK